MKLEAIGARDRSSVVDVLTNTFYDYPVMRYALSDAGADYPSRLRALHGFFCDVRYARDWPVLGIRDGDTLAAVMLLSEPVSEPRPIDLTVVDHDLADAIGQDAVARLQRYEEMSASIEPDLPNYFVGMLGTLSGFRGRGMARALLDHAAERAERHTSARGVCLATEDPANVPFYQRVGYEIHGEVQIGPIHSWCMWRPNA